jgi:hypothetical protein
VEKRRMCDNSVTLEGVDKDKLGLVIEGAEREVDAMDDLHLEGTEEYREAVTEIREAYEKATEE